MLISVIICLFSVIRFYQEYTEPDENSSSSQTSLRRDANPLHPRHSSSSTSEDDNVVLPLGENILSQNLGIPIVVVITKVIAFDFLYYLHAITQANKLKKGYICLSHG